MTDMTDMKNNPPRTNRPGRFSRSRRGTIVILAVGILAVLAVATLSYMTVVRLDRSSASAYATVANFRQQVNAASSHIRALIGADLFGNKVVTGGVPESSGPYSIWPRMFEDGEYRDYPSVDSEWLNNPTDPARGPGFMVDDAWYLPLDVATSRFPVARPDDAWLASQEPVDSIADADLLPDTWPQITNLRSGWYYKIQPGASIGYWQRDHGRYVDLCEWLTNSQGDAYSATLGRGDPGLEIDRFDTSTAYSTPYVEDNETDLGAQNPMHGGPNLGVDRALRAGGTLGTNLRVWDYQQSRVQEFLDGDTSDPDDMGFTVVNNIDERMWADTDGDGRADARWQELDSLGELFGYRWVIAARIIDNSAMINVNSSLEWQFPGDSSSVGMGRTPGDIDLYRLLRRSQDFNNNPDTNLPIGHPDVLANATLGGQVNRLWNHQRVSGWRLPDAFDAINDAYSTAYPGVWLDLTHVSASPILETTPLDAREREMFWRTAGASPQSRQTIQAIPVPIVDEIDLRAIAGSNYPQITSSIEQRLEQVEQGGLQPALGWLPGIDPPSGATEDYPLQNSLGLLRSKEDGRDVRTFGLNAVTPEMDFASNNYFQTNKIHRYVADIRRHMTTINGVSDVSPVPVLDTVAYPGKYANEKIRIDDPDLIRPQVANTTELNAYRTQIKDFVNEAFGAFLWALAPMLTDRPIMWGLTENDTGDQADDIDFMYGGGMTGPAERLDNQMGSAYAVLRSLSLAVNLADALDRDLNDRESPTIVRFAPPANMSGGPVPPPPSLDAGFRDFRPATGFTHGALLNDVFTAGTAQQHVGSSSEGVTLIGLDRQPFLMEAATIAVLEDSRDPVTGMDTPVVDPTQADDQIVSYMFFELGNPWPEQINVSDYVIRISADPGAPDPTKDFLLALGQLLSGSSALILPGTSKTFMIQFDPDTSMLPGMHFQDVRDRFHTQLMTELAGNSLAIPGNLAELDPMLTGSTVIPTGNGAVPFSSYYTSTKGVVQLCYHDAANDELYLVDRLTGPDNDFPWPNSAGLPGFSMFPFDNMLMMQVTGSGRAVFTSSLRRPKQQPAGGGFPAYIIEQPLSNIPMTGLDFVQWELAPAPQHSTVDPIDDPTTLPENLPPLALPVTDLNLNGGALAGMPNMQLFVPDGPLRSVAELHMLSVFTNMYVHESNAVYASDTTSMFGALRYAYDNARTGPGSWRTVSEQLGEDAHWLYNGTVGVVNPYLGVLDPSRFVLGGDLAPSPASGDPWPDGLRIPLADRVFDCFTVTPNPSGLAQGKINLNTAPIEVLKSMPFFDPETDVTSSESDTLPASADRATIVRDYRDLRNLFASMGDRESLTGITGLRTNGADPDHFGLVNVAELLNMTSHDTNTGATSTMSGFSADFGQLGSDTTPSDGAPLSLRYSTSAYGGGTVNRDFNEFTPYDTRNDFANSSFDPQDDPEERLALARSALDIASTRSDVFTAYFVLRAYNPEQIEIIQTQGISDLPTLATLIDEQAGAVTSPGLRPVYESRWLGVYDRSAVRRPTDKPRTLLLVELPIN
ncbi:MAG: hypothetical protein H6814_04635 [Phycisphaeraceae bacterium]|nr:hypothetical protein [Phycisphaeraceae bacterium]